MAVAKIVEITANSTTSFDDAVTSGIAKAGESIRGIKGAWVKDQELRVEDSKVVEYRVNLKITFVLE
ncbi:MAG: dodecin family protein [Solirubrobacterales bacterium]